MPMKYSSGFRQFLKKSLIFLVLFIIVSGIIGPWVIGTRLLYGFYFFLYGNLGKMVLFSAIVFFLLTRDRILSLPKSSYDKRNIAFLVLAFLLLPVFFITATNLLKEASFTSNLPLSLAAHALTILIPLLLLIGVFGKSFLVKFATSFRKALLVCLGLSVVFDIAIFYVWRLWPLLSNIVLRIEYALFSLIFPHVEVIPPRTLFVEKFAVSIEQACSGLDSLFLFSVLFLLIAILEWKSFHHKRLLVMFILSSIGLFFVNVLRVFLLILAGVLISPKITAQLFHTYLGMVLFIIYFLLFLKFFYQWMKK